MQTTRNGFGGVRRPCLRFGIALVVGIVTGYAYDGLDVWPLYYCLCAFSMMYLFLMGVRWYKRRYAWSSVFGVLTWVILMLVGCLRVLQQHPEGRASHFAHRLEGITAYEGMVSGLPRQGKFRQDVLLSVKRVRCDGVWYAVSGNCKLLFPIDLKGVVDGITLRIVGRPVAIRGVTNPHVVDYNRRWRLQGAFHEHVVKKTSTITKLTPACRWRDWRHQVLARSRAKISAAIADKEVAGVVLALLLGDRQGLQEVGKVYKKAGVMHVLALSGLHVGLIYGLMMLLFGLLTALFGGWLGRPRHHRWMALLLLWGYAVLVGFSPSIVRAVGALSLMTLARTLRRPYDRINGLFALLFFFLLYNPCWLFDLGFQLSFMAMAGIFLFYTPIVTKWHPKNRYLHYGWQGAALSIAAQLTTTPLSIYYFHRFPLYFLLGNAVMIPMVTCLLVLGIALLILTWVGFQVNMIADVLLFLIRKATLYLRWVGGLPGAYLGPFHWCVWVVLFCYLILGGMYVGVRSRRMRYFIFVTCLISVVSGGSIRFQFMRAHQRHIVVYDLAYRRVFGFIKGRKAILLANEAIDADLGYYRYQIQPGLDWWGVTSIVQGGLSKQETPVRYRKVGGVHLYEWEGKRVALLDRKYDDKDTGTCVAQEVLVVDLICIMDAPIKDLARRIRGMKVGLILLAKRNKHYADLVEEATRLGIPVKTGSYVLSCRS